MVDRREQSDCSKKRGKAGKRARRGERVLVAAEPRCARRIAPEDVRVGSFVSIRTQRVHVITEDPVTGRLATTSLEIAPAWAEPPRRVVAVCLPFVVVKERRGAIETLDVRRVTLFRWPKRTARVVRRAMRARS